MLATVRIMTRGQHPNAHLQRAWHLWGYAYFVFEIIEKGLNLDELHMREQFHIDRTQAADMRFGYNLAAMVNPPNLGMKRSAAGRAAMALSAKRRWASMSSDERTHLMDNLKLGRINNAGWHHTEEARERISIGHTGLKYPNKKKLTPEQEARRLAAMRLANTTRVYKTKVTSVQAQCIRLLQSIGIRQGRLATMFGVKQLAISDIIRGYAKAHGIPTVIPFRFGLTAEQLSEIRNLYVSGLNYRQVSERVGLKEHHVWKIINGKVYADTFIQIARRRGSKQLPGGTGIG